MQKLIAEQEFQKDRLSERILLSLALVVGVLSVLRVLLANWLVEKAETIRVLDEKILVGQRENRKEEQNIRQKQSLVYLREKAQASGFSPFASVSYLGSGLGVAYFPNEPVSIR